VRIRSGFVADACNFEIASVATTFAAFITSSDGWIHDTHTIDRDCTLLLLPLLLFGGVVRLALWDQGLLLWLTWTIPVCWGMAWLFLRRLKRVELPAVEIGFSCSLDAEGF